MGYQALYRQWRPATFQDMVGQETIVTTLRNQIMQGRIAHAYLFCGSRGTGKTSTSKIMARAVNCLNPQNGDACGECENCRRLSGDDNLDIIEIDAASNNGVEEIRDLREKVKYPPQYGKYKVYIIDEVHMLSTAAFNALLKTLEEPPAHVIFILATTEPQRLPATVLSRCQRFDFTRIPADQIVGRLKQIAEKAGAVCDQDALYTIARASEGGMRDAISTLDMCLGYSSQVNDALVRTVLGTADKHFLFQFADALKAESVADVLRLIDELMRSGRDPIVFAKDVSQHLRTLLMGQACKEELAELLEITKEDAAQYLTQCGDVSSQRLLRMLDIFMAVETDMRWASSPRIALEAAAIRACLKTKDADTAALNDRIAQLEAAVKKLEADIASGSVVVAAQAVPSAPKPAAKASPASRAPAPSNLTGGAVWDAAKKELMKSTPSLSGPLSFVRFAGCQNDVYRVTLPESQSIFLKMLNSEKHRTTIDAALTQAAGKPSRMEAALDAPAASPTQQKQAEHNQAELIETFGRDKLKVEET